MKTKSKDMSTLSQARKVRCRDYNDDILLGNAKDDGIVQTTNSKTGSENYSSR